MEDPIVTGNLNVAVSCRNDIDLLFAAEYGHLDIVKYGYFLGFNTNRMFEDACEKEYCDIVDFLLAQGVNPEPHLLSIACKNGNCYIFNALVQRIENVGNQFDSSMSKACKNGRKDFVLQLYNYGYDVNKLDNKGYNGLHYACQNRDLEMVQLLLDLGADNQTSDCGVLPIHFACVDKFYGRDNRTFRYRALPIHFACVDKIYKGDFLGEPTAIQESPEVVRDRIEIIKLLLPSCIKTSIGNKIGKQQLGRKLLEKLSKTTGNESIKEFILSFEYLED